MRIPSLDEQNEIADALCYDSATGEMTWNRTGPRVLIGDAAGSVRSDGRLVVTVKGRQYQAAHVAWFFIKGLWPTSQIVYRNGNAADLSADNLLLHETTKAPTSKAGQMRRYRERKRAKQKNAPPASTVPNVTHSFDGSWVVRASWDARIILASFADQKTAESYGQQCLDGYLFVRDHWVPYEYTHRDSEGEHILTGPKGTLSLAEAHRRFAYDHERGMIYRRDERQIKDHPGELGLFRHGVPAVEPHGHKRWIVRSRGRVFTAGMLAWFLATGDWPKRKQLAYRDGDQRNIKIANLYLKGSPDAEPGP